MNFKPSILVYLLLLNVSVSCSSPEEKLFEAMKDCPLGDVKI